MARPVLRFAPSPNGLLHLGHAYSALLNADLARRMGGALLLRIEDIDPARSRPELIVAILRDLAWLGLTFDGPIRRQSEHLDLYRGAVADLARRGLAYPCFCSRGEVAAAAGPAPERDPDGAPLYPGACRSLSPSEIASRQARGLPHAWRLDMGAALAAAPGPHRVATFAPGGGEGAHSAAPSRWGDAVVARRDTPTSYHLAVVMDDAAQGVSHVARGADLLAATDLHVLLQRLLGSPSPRYHHHALILSADGHKLAKSRGSPSLAQDIASGATPELLRARLGFL